MTISRSWPPRFPLTLVTAAALMAAGLVVLFVGYVFGILTEFWFLCLVLLLAVLGFAVLVTVRVVEDSSGGTHLWWRIFTAGFRVLNFVIPWYRLPRYLGSMNLLSLRQDLRQRNLHDTSRGFTHADRKIAGSTDADAQKPELTWDSQYRAVRTADGTFNDFRDPLMGSAGTRFGRNTPPERIVAEDTTEPGSPSPREVSLRLMTRDHFIPATSLNLLAAAWIQFENHDWFNHLRSRELISVPLRPGDPWPENPMRVRRTAPDTTHNGRVPTFVNTESHWWDASQLYGSRQEIQQKVRAHEGGRLRLDGGRLPADQDPALSGIDQTGFNQNYWAGLSLLHTLFSLEHNAICDRLRQDHPHFSDEQLFQKARLINAALIAKIHTIEWTPAILGHPALAISMNGNWSGLLGANFKMAFGRISESEAVSGIAGSPTHQHTAPYYLTEEFVSVYRLHPLIPDDYVFRSVRDHSETGRATFDEIQGNRTRPTLDQYGMADLLYSFGVSHPGAVTLHNFPRALQNFEFLKDNPRRIDLAAVDILRDRERAVPRYNDFRRMLRKKPVRKFRQLTKDPRSASEIEEVYGGQIDQVDLMVGLFGEPLPPGFGFSDTAFRIFILMASRRLKSDRFFTVDYTPAVYTPAGIDWVEKNDMRSVLLRHFPELAPALTRCRNAFAPWSRVG